MVKRWKRKTHLVFAYEGGNHVRGPEQFEWLERNSPLVEQSWSEEAGEQLFHQISTTNGRNGAGRENKTTTGERERSIEAKDNVVSTCLGRTLIRKRKKTRENKMLRSGRFDPRREKKEGAPEPPRPLEKQDLAGRRKYKNRHARRRENVACSKQGVWSCGLVSLKKPQRKTRQKREGPAKGAPRPRTHAKIKLKGLGQMPKGRKQTKSCATSGAMGTKKRAEL